MGVVMAKQHDDDLFKDTTMTFGEHLEELRVCLFRAVMGLLITGAIGLAIGDKFVHMIERPLVLALKTYYKSQALVRYKVFMEDQIAAGISPTYTLDEIQATAAPTEESKQEFLYEVKWVHLPTIAPVQKLTDEEKTTHDAKKAEEAEQAKSKEKKAEPKAEETDEEKAKKEAAIRYRRNNLTPLLLWHPIDTDQRISLSTLSATEAFSIWMKASLVVGFVLASPWVFYQIWIFVAAGLYPHERKYVYYFLPMSLGLFLLGVSTAYFFVFAPVLEFLFGFNEWLGINPDPRISEWMSFVLLLPLGFGISFQLPLVMLFLNRIGIFDVRAYIEKWRIAVLVIFILSAVLTPADPYSMLLMAVPLTILYFGGVILCKYMPKVA
jgi:sec-independent protein translocase protein TatC